MWVMELILGEKIRYAQAKRELKLLLKEINVVKKWVKSDFEFENGEINCEQLLDRIANLHEVLKKQGAKLDGLEQVTKDLFILISSVHQLDAYDQEIVYLSLIKNVTDERLAVKLKMSRPSATKKKQRCFKRLYEQIIYMKFIND